MTNFLNRGPRYQDLISVTIHYIHFPPPTTRSPSVYCSTMAQYRVKVLNSPYWTKTKYDSYWLLQGQNQSDRIIDIRFHEESLKAKFIPSKTTVIREGKSGSSITLNKESERYRASIAISNRNVVVSILSLTTSQPYCPYWSEISCVD